MLAATLTTTLFIGVSQVGAEPAATYETKSNIIFKQNTDKGPGIVDPEDPDPTKPVDPTDPDIDEGTNGPLSIDYVSNFRFGEQFTSGNDTVYHASLVEVVLADGTAKEVPNFLQITDDRGNGAGWHLTVKQAEQFKAGDMVLEGAALSLHNPTLSSVSSKKEPQTKDPVTINPGKSASLVMSAEAKHGMGTWTNSFGKGKEQGEESVQLFVPGETVVTTEEVYQTKLTWALNNTP